LVPFNVVLALGLTGLILLWTRFAQAGRRLLAIGGAIFVVVAATPLPFGLILPLDQRFPRLEPSDAPQGIIVLGGAIDPRLSAARNEISLTGAAERVAVVAALSRRYPAASIILSGGSDKRHPSESLLAAQMVRAFGISADRVLTEERSLNTAQNANFTTKLIAGRNHGRWLLVTSAVHMPRAVGAFRHAGLQVDAYPVDWQTVGRSDLLSFFPGASSGFSICDAAVHEWIGLIAYWLQGRTSAFFPAPEAPRHCEQCAAN
jgi:uncharacterized SAM-binding protein YcdF (DUF218 family)